MTLFAVALIAFGLIAGGVLNRLRGGGWKETLEGFKVAVILVLCVLIVAPPVLLRYDLGNLSNAHVGQIFVSLAAMYLAFDAGWGAWYTIGRNRNTWDSSLPEFAPIDLLLRLIFGKYWSVAQRDAGTTVYPNRSNWLVMPSPLEPPQPRDEVWRWRFDFAAMTSRGSLFGMAFAVPAFLWWGFSPWVWLLPVLTGLGLWTSYAVGWRAYFLWAVDFGFAEAASLPKYREKLSVQHGPTLLWVTLPMMLKPFIMALPETVRRQLWREPYEISELLHGHVLLLILGGASLLHIFV